MGIRTVASRRRLATARSCTKRCRCRSCSTDGGAARTGQSASPPPRSNRRSVLGSQVSRSAAGSQERPPLFARATIRSRRPRSRDARTATSAALHRARIVLTLAPAWWAQRASVRGSRGAEIVPATRARPSGHMHSLPVCAASSLRPCSFEVRVRPIYLKRIDSDLTIIKRPATFANVLEMVRSDRRCRFGMVTRDAGESPLQVFEPDHPRDWKLSGLSMLDRHLRSRYESGIRSFLAGANR